jgi:hypothetical protein
MVGLGKIIFWAIIVAVVFGGAVGHWMLAIIIVAALLVPFAVLARLLGLR